MCSMCNSYSTYILLPMWLQVHVLEGRMLSAVSWSSCTTPIDNVFFYCSTAIFFFFPPGLSCLSNWCSLFFHNHYPFISTYILALLWGLYFIVNTSFVFCRVLTIYMFSFSSSSFLPPLFVPFFPSCYSSFHNSLPLIVILFFSVIQIV
jgi:hypothetical protein